MFRKAYQLNIALLLLGLGTTTSAGALECTRVAKIHWVEKIDHVLIFRGGMKGQPGEWAGQETASRELCAGDVVIVPKEFEQLEIEYYQEKPQPLKLKRGQQYTVEALKEPCVSWWCKGLALAENWVEKLTKTAPSESPTTIVQGKGSDPDNSLFMPLAAGEGLEYPFYLFSHELPIPLLWRGGLPPYRLEVKDSKGETVMQQAEIKDNAFCCLKLPNQESGQEYLLTLVTATGETVQKRLIFTTPPFPLPPQLNCFELFGRLLQDQERNWRLEIWRRLRTLPESQTKIHLAGHLRLGNFCSRRDAQGKEVGVMEICPWRNSTPK